MLLENEPGRVLTAADTRTWAYQVAEGLIPAAVPVRAAVGRSWADYCAPPAPWRWSERKADRVLAICRERIRFTTGGEWVGQPFIPLPWQAWFFADLFGWVHAETGIRRYRKAVLCTGKSSGKNTMLAATAIIMAAYDGFPASQVVTCAATRDQARNVFDAIVNTIRLDGEDARRERRKPFLDGRLKITGGVEAYRVDDLKTRSWIKRISHDRMGRGSSGYDLHAAIIDEYHEHPTAKLRLILEAGMKSSPEPLSVIATNAGEDASGHAWEEIQAAEAVAVGAIDNPRLLPFIARMEPDHDEQDERVWPLANPSYPVTPNPDYLRDEAAKARASLQSRGLFRRLNLGLWESLGEEQWLRPQQVDPCLVDERPDWVEGASCWAAGDLSRRRDITALAVCWKHPEEDRFHLEVQSWLPGQGLGDRERATGLPLQAWKAEGTLILTPGDIIGMDAPAGWLAALNKAHPLEKFGADPYWFRDFSQACRMAGIPLQDPEDPDSGGLPCTWHHQGYYVPRDAWGEDGTGLAMAQSIVAAEDLILNGRVTILRNAPLRAAVFGAMVVTDGKANRMFTKKHSKVPIDPLVAGVMAMGCAVVESRQEADDTWATALKLYGVE